MGESMSRKPIKQHKLANQSSTSTDPKELIESLQKSLKVFADSMPTVYSGSDDEVGRCAHCNEWNHLHTQDCEIIVAQALVIKAKKYLSEQQ